MGGGATSPLLRVVPQTGAKIDGKFVPPGVSLRNCRRPCLLRLKLTLEILYTRPLSAPAATSFTGTGTCSTGLTNAFPNGGWMSAGLTWNNIWSPSEGDLGVVLAKSRCPATAPLKPVGADCVA